MIDRYATEEMKKIWNNENKYRVWLKVELAVLKAYAEKGIIPKDDYLKIEKRAKIDAKRIDELEAETRHDVIAFTRAVGENLGAEGRWFHYGLTSTDVVDTANALMLKEANILIEKELWRLINILKKKALAYKNTPCIGRTHGIHAEVTSFGLKWALWYDEALRDLRRFREARLEVERGKLSGAVGNFANIDPEIEKTVCADLGIGYARISTQVLSRDLHINYLHSLALIAGLLEKIATEIRHLSRTEIREAEEYFAPAQKGSSAMPHKRNPIASENICGLSRVIRGYLFAAYECNALWHERDISHSSVERIAIPDASSLIHYMLRRYAGVLDNLLVYPEQMMKNIKLTNGVIFSGSVVSMMIEKGFSREESYDFIQKIALRAYAENIDFLELLLESDLVKRFEPEEIKARFNLDYYLRNIDKIYQRLKLEDEK
ncbi:MAG: adenylosuccinate lyase [Bacilli bacterium]|jgi:adenylosuccinate lyase|nr:adenylosuccinate lyase [Acholeplasmataceae bacterium]